MMNLSIPFLLAVIAVLLVILFLFTIYLFVQRRREMIFNKKRASYLRRLTQPWHDYLFEDKAFSIRLIPRGRPDVAAIEYIFSSCLKNVSHSDIREKIKAFSNLYLKEFYQKDLSNKRWSIRMNALYRIADFGMSELLDFCQTFEQKNISKDEYFQLLKIYSSFQPNLFIEKLKQLQGSYPESEYRRLLLLLEEDMFIQLFDDFQAWPVKLQFALIDTAAVKRNMLYMDKLKQLLADDNTEIRIRALKGLYEIGIIDEIDSFVPFVYSPVWEERLMAAKICKYAPTAYKFTYLEHLLQDKNWWVRSQAAATIAEDRQGTTILKQFIQFSDDQYAIEMAKEVLNRKREMQ